MTTPEDAIRARRRLTNKIIASHEAARLKPFLHPKVKLITGDGTLLVGAEEVVDAFANHFRDPDFLVYVRTTSSVSLDHRGERAAEAGDWVGSWKQTSRSQGSSGRYFAVWCKSVGQWVLESELYVILAEGDPPD
jgi:hypothetical protein